MVTRVWALGQGTSGADLEVSTLVQSVAAQGQNVLLSLCNPTLGQAVAPLTFYRVVVLTATPVRPVVEAELPLIYCPV